MSDNTEMEYLLNNIKKLENEYQVSNKSLQENKKKIIEDERALLICMQELMPMQNKYLSNVIKALQSQLTKQKTNITKEFRENNIKDDLEQIPEIKLKPNRRRDTYPTQIIKQDIKLPSIVEEPYESNKQDNLEQIPAIKLKTNRIAPPPIPAYN